MRIGPFESGTPGQKASSANNFPLFNFKPWNTIPSKMHNIERPGLKLQKSVLCLDLTSYERFLLRFLGLQI